MNEYLAIAAYRCFIEGEPTDSLDFQIRYFKVRSKQAVLKHLRTEKPGPYRNPAGETIDWRLVEILCVDEFRRPESGDEVTGFIAGLDELKRLAESPLPGVRHERPVGAEDR